MGAIGIYHMRELLYQGRSMRRHLDLRNEGYSLCINLFFVAYLLSPAFF